jgi:outer membrane protein assembly factor BamB
VQIKGGRAWLTNQRLQVLDRQTLKPVWRATQEAQPGSSVGLLVGKERAYLHDGKAIHALDSVSGRHLWTYATPSPAQAEDQGVLYFTQNTDVHLLDAATGTLRSRMPAKDLRLYPFGSLTVSEGLIYAVATRPHNFLSGFSGTADTALCAKEPSTGKNAWCTDWRYEYLNAPVLAGNLLFAGTTGEAGRPATLYAIKTK